jgi:hypothetical protein
VVRPFCGIFYYVRALLSILLGGVVMAALNQTNVNDFNFGKRDKSGGFYDKWYRYNRLDDGAAYDAGFRSVEFTKEIVIIECSDLSR